MKVIFEKTPNDGLQLRRAISIRADGAMLLEKHAIAPSAARLCWTASYKERDYFTTSSRLRIIKTAGATSPSKTKITETGKMSQLFLPCIKPINPGTLI